MVESPGFPFRGSVVREVTVQPNPNAKTPWRAIHAENILVNSIHRYTGFGLCRWFYFAQFLHLALNGQEYGDKVWFAFDDSPAFPMELGDFHTVPTGFQRFTFQALQPPSDSFRYTFDFYMGEDVATYIHTPEPTTSENRMSWGARLFGLPTIPKPQIGGSFA